MHQDTFIWENEVRDNELDAQGIVNNANYFIYMAYARFKHFKSLGFDLVEMHAQGLNFVLVRSEIDFKSPLKAGDEFIVSSKFEPVGKVRVVFFQQVLRKSDQKVMASAKNIIACVSVASGRPVAFDKLITGL